MKSRDQLAATLIAEIVARESCRVVDDVQWDQDLGEYVGSLLWHGVPINPTTLRIFADYVDVVCHRPDVVVGVRSSGLPWATAAALRWQVPMVPLRLQPHEYGPADELDGLHGTAAVVDNHCGSGTTLSAVRRRIHESNLTSLSEVVVESRDCQYVESVIVVRKKLEAVAQARSADTLLREVAARVAADDGWSRDKAWVDSVLSRLTGV